MKCFDERQMTSTTTAERLIDAKTIRVTEPTYLEGLMYTKHDNYLTLPLSLSLSLSFIHTYIHSPIHIPIHTHIRSCSPIHNYPHTMTLLSIHTYIPPVHIPSHTHIRSPKHNYLHTMSLSLPYPFTSISFFPLKNGPFSASFSFYFRLFYKQLTIIVQ